MGGQSAHRAVPNSTEPGSAYLTRYFEQGPLREDYSERIYGGKGSAGKSTFTARRSLAVDRRAGYYATGYGAEPTRARAPHLTPAR